MPTHFSRLSAFVGAALALLVAAAHPAAAQAQAQPTNEQLFLSFLQSPAYQNFLDQALAQTDPAVFKAECARMTMRENARWAAVRPASFTVVQGQGAIVDGVWIAWIPVDRCGTPTIRRLLIVVSGPNNLVPTRMLPGEFGGDLRLEADVQRTVLPLFQEMAECRDEKQVFVADIKITRQSATAWQEHWLGNACGKPTAILVNYIRRGNSIDFATDLPPQLPRAPQAMPQAPVLVPMPAQPVPGLRPGLPAAPPPGLPTRPGGVAK
jgi:hypothetical protein